MSEAVPDFRCSVASRSRDEPLAGSASTVRAFLLVENGGPWGTDAFRDARMDEGVRDGLRERAHRARVRPLMIRRHRGVGEQPGLRVFAAYAHPLAPWMETAVVTDPAVLLDLDLEALGRGTSPGLTPTTEPVFLVCTHGRHDACCAELGRPAASALSRSHPQQTWEVSHVGGDRFAANLLVLPDGLYYGRVGDLDAPTLAARHLDGHLDVDRLRGRSGFAMPVQVAEVALRRELGRTEHDALRLLWSRPGPEDGESSVSFEVDGATYAVRVRRSDGPGAQLTCRATRDNPTPVWDVLEIAEAPASGPQVAAE